MGCPPPPPCGATGTGGNLHAPRARSRDLFSALLALAHASLQSREAARNLARGAPHNPHIVWNMDMDMDMPEETYT